MYTSRILFLCLFVTILGYSQTTYKIDEKYIYSWDDTAMDWKHDFSDQYTYGNGGTKETVLLRISVPSLENLNQNLKTYNSNNNIILDQRQFWNPGTSMWMNNSQVVYTYNTSDYLIEETNQVYNLYTMTYGNFSRELYEYTGANRTKQTSQTWNGAAWTNTEEADITYSGSLPIQIVRKSWNGTTMMWEPYERDTVTYNTNDQPSEILEESYNMGAWETSGRTVYSYSGLLQTEALFQDWNGTAWVNADRQLNGYDANDNMNELILEEWNDTSSLWEGLYKEDRFYSPAGPLSAASFERSNIKIYPNPVNDILNLEIKFPMANISAIDLFGLDGRLLHSLQINNNIQTKEIDFTGISRGQYLLVVRDNDYWKQVFKILKN